MGWGKTYHHKHPHVVRAEGGRVGHVNPHFLYKHVGIRLFSIHEVDFQHPIFVVALKFGWEGGWVGRWMREGLSFFSVLEMDFQHPIFVVALY